MMDRLQKKCFIVTSSLHGLLVGVLLFGSALMPARTDENNVKLFTAYDPTKVSDLLSSSGGDPDVKVPVSQPPANPQPKQQEAPPPPAPKPKSEPKPEPPVSKPEPKVEPKPEPKLETRPEPKVIHNVRNDMPSLRAEKRHEKKTRLTPDEMVAVTTPKHKIHINKESLKATTRNNDDKAQAEQEAADAEARAQRRRAAREFASAFRNISRNLSSLTPLVQSTPGPGGGGEVTASYRDLIASKYYNAWSPPAYLDEATPIVVASVTIGRDGNVISARITKPSGNSMMDRSIQNVLDAVTYFEPFPAGSSDEQRTFTIHFNLQAKRQIG